MMLEFTCVKAKVANINFVEIIITFISRCIHPDRGDTISVRIFLGLTHLNYAITTIWKPNCILHLL